MFEFVVSLSPQFLFMCRSVYLFSAFPRCSCASLCVFEIRAPLKLIVMLLTLTWVAAFPFLCAEKLLD